MKPSEARLPAVTASQMAEVDRLMVEEYGIQLIQMMENAGRALAEQARRMLGGEVAGRSIVVLCGAGNNGGGGMAATRHLANAGAQARAALVGDVARFGEVTARQWSALQTMRVQAAKANLRGADLVIDALIGYGLRGNPRGDVAQAIHELLACRCPVLALDMPSGLDPTTGRPGSPCVRATATLTLALPKTGLLAPEAAPYVGDLFVADISVPPGLYASLGIEVGPLFRRDSILAVSPV